MVVPSAWIEDVALDASSFGSKGVLDLMVGVTLLLVESGQVSVPAVLPFLSPSGRGFHLSCSREASLKKLALFLKCFPSSVLAALL